MRMACRLDIFYLWLLYCKGQKKCAGNLICKLIWCNLDIQYNLGYMCAGR